MIERGRARENVCVCVCLSKIGGDELVLLKGRPLFHSLLLPFSFLMQLTGSCQGVLMFFSALLSSEEIDLGKSPYSLILSMRPP